MGEIVQLFHGRSKARESIPKPRECDECGDDIETARLQVQPKANRCISCEAARERRQARAMSAARDQDVIIVRR